MRTIKLFEEFSYEESIQEETEQVENKFNKIIDLLNKTDDVFDIKCNDEECDFIFNNLDFNLKLEDESILVCVEGEYKDSLGSFKPFEADKIAEVIINYNVE